MSKWNNRIVEYAEVDPKHLIPNPKNWRTHSSTQSSVLKGVMNEVGIVQNVIVNRKTGRLIDGHLRVELAIKTNQATVPVTYVEVEEAEESYLLATLDPISALAGSDVQILQELLTDVKTTDDSVADLIQQLANQDKLYWNEDTNEVTTIDSTTSKKVGAKHKDAKLVDAIFTWSDPREGVIEMALKAGLSYGIRSGYRVSSNAAPIFIDNEYTEYNHELHLDYVRTHKPKYATVLDLFTKQQAEKLNIQYRSFDEIMKYAEELNEYADNVIVIPKYDCIKDIPKKFMLGYSIPSKYGGTNLPYDLFTDHKIHLLGGSPKAQWKYFNYSRESVMSVDTNYIYLVSSFGQIADYSFMSEEWNIDAKELKAKSLSKIMPVPVTNPLYCSLVINIGLYAMMWKKTATDLAAADNVSIEDVV